MDSKKKRSMKKETKNTNKISEIAVTDINSCFSNQEISLLNMVKRIKGKEL